MKRKTMFLFFTLLLLSFAMVLTNCGDDDGGDGPTVCNDPTVDVNGTWAITENEKPNTCGDGLESFNLHAVQSGKNVTVTDDYSNEFSGTVCGNVLSYSGSYPDEGGTTTISLTATVSGNSVSGSATWSWTDGYDDCSGTTVFTGAKQ